MSHTSPNTPAPIAHGTPAAATGNAPPHKHHGVGHVVSFKILFGVFASLTFLTVVTYVASLFDFGELNLFVALAIAVVKASLVVLFFMHLLWDRPFNAIVFIGCLIFVGLFISLALLDTHQYHASKDDKQAPKLTRPLLKAE